ncbi:MAG: 50S ribosomal protein L33 [Dehalococcoides mccartyi]
MAKKTDTRIVINMACTDCGERNYTTEKNKRNDPRRIELSKYCPRCREAKVQRETK